MAELKDPYFYIPDGAFEKSPLFSPWAGVCYGDFGKRVATSRSQQPRGRLYYIHEHLLQSLQCTDAKEVWECGTWRGETALFLGALANEFGAKLRLFDTFAGMPETLADKDAHKAGDFSDTSPEFVKSRFAHMPDLDLSLQVGLIPKTFAGLEKSRIAFAHIDLDIYQAILDSLDFVWPRLAVGGSVVFDDYAWASCPGAREAVDLFFSKMPERVVVLPTGQACVTKLTEAKAAAPTTTKLTKSRAKA